MIIRPFEENSIEDEFLGVEYAGKIALNITKDYKKLQVQTTENGLDTSARGNNEPSSRASQIIKDGIYFLYIKLKAKAGFSIDNAQHSEDSTTGNGVIVKIHLRLLYKAKQVIRYNDAKI